MQPIHVAHPEMLPGANLVVRGPFSYLVLLDGVLIGHQEPGRDPNRR